MSAPNQMNMNPGGVPPQKKSNTLLFVLLGCGGLIVIAGIVMAVLGFFAFQKAKEVGFDADMLKDNPGEAIARMIAAADPDVEMVEYDEDTKKVTMRNKKTGETTTVDFEDLKEGRLTFETGEGKATISSSGEGDDQTIRLTAPDGSQIVAGAEASADLPSWAPAYPGASVKPVMNQLTADGIGTMLVQMETNDNQQQVLRYYADKMRELGFNAHEISPQGPDTGGMVSCDDQANKRAVMIGTEPKGGKTTITMSLSQEK